MSTFKPMLAVAADLAKLKYPVYASPKLDGIRCAVVRGVAYTRSLKRIPNLHIDRTLSKMMFAGLDGELILGSATSKTVYRDTVSAVMSVDGEPDISFHVFDMHDVSDSFEKRLAMLRSEADKFPANVKMMLLMQHLIHNETELLEYENAMIEVGYEGVILRSPDAPYKFGRSTVNEGYLLKLKRFEDSEAEIIGFEEEMLNGNEAQTNELGRTKRSSAQAGKSGKGTLGAFLVRDAKTGVEFSIGTGLTATERQTAWNDRSRLLGSFRKYKFFPVGVKDKPRHPVDLGPRNPRDMS